MNEKRKATGIPFSRSIVRIPRRERVKKVFKNGKIKHFLFRMRNRQLNFWNYIMRKMGPEKLTLKAHIEDNKAGKVSVHGRDKLVRMYDVSGSKRLDKWEKRLLRVTMLIFT